MLIVSVIAVGLPEGIVNEKAYAAGANLALKKEAFASSMYNDTGNYAPEKINDGNYFTLWSDGAVKYTGPVAGYYYIAVDLADQYIINQIIAYPRIDFDDSAQLHNWYIQLSNTRDFSDAVTVAHIESKCEYGGKFVFNVDSQDSYRYVRIASPKAYFTCGELEVFGEKYDPETMSGKDNFTDTKNMSYNGAAAVCSALGIINATGKATFEGEKMFTRAAAAKAISVMMGYAANEGEESVFADVPDNYYAKDYIMAAYRNNIISKSEKFRPDEYITCGEFSKMIIYAFGYEENVKEYSDWRAGVTSVSKSLRLQKNVENEFDDKLSRGIAAQLIYNALRAPLNELKFKDMYSDTLVLEPSESSALYDLFKMYIVEGILTENSASNLTHPSDKNEARAVIDGKEFKDRDGLLQKMLGKRVGAIVAEDDNDIIAGFEETTVNEIITVQSDDCVSVSKGIYTYEDGDKNKKIRFDDKDVYVIKNYCAFPDWTYDDLRPKDGYIEFIDNDADGRTDVISIFEPEIIIGGYVLSTDGNIHVVGNDGSKLTAQKPAWARFLKNGKITTPGKFMEGDVIFVYRADNDAIVLIEGFSSSVSGTVASQSSDEITIDNVAYKVSSYYNSLTDKDMLIKLGEKNTVLTDGRGRIICAYNDRFNADTDFFGFVCDAYSEQREGYITIFTSKGAFVTYNFADNVKLNEVSIKSNKLVERLDKGEAFVKDKIIKFRLNTEGKVSRIDVLEKVNVTLGENVVYIKNGHGVYNKGWLVQPLKPDTICFTLPKRGNSNVYSRSYEKYYIADEVRDHMSELSQITEKWDFYDADELGYPTVAVRYKELAAAANIDVRSVNSSKDIVGLIVKSVNVGINDDEEKTYIINGYDMSGNSKTIVLDSEITDIYRADDIQGDHFDWLNDEKDIVTDRLSPQDIADYSMSVSELKTGDIIRAEISDDIAVAVERTFKAYSGKNGEYTRETDGTYYSAGKTYPQYPDAEYRLIYGLAKEIKKDVFIMSTCERIKGEGALTQYVPYNELERLVICRDGKIEIYSGSELPAYMKVGTETVLFTSERAKPACLIIYE